jgi:hypothetical protein
MGIEQTVALVGHDNPKEVWLDGEASVGSTK